MFRLRLDESANRGKPDGDDLPRRLPLRWAVIGFISRSPSRLLGLRRVALLARSRWASASRLRSTS